MRFLSVQYLAYFEYDLWLKNAQHANAMAQLLAQELKKIPDLTISRPVTANSVFVQIPRAHIQEIQKHFFFYCVNEQTNEYRLMTAFDTKPEHVQELVKLIKNVMG